MKAWKDKSIDNLSDKLDRIEDEIAIANEEDYLDFYGEGGIDLEKLSPEERHALYFEWRMAKQMPLYKAEVMAAHNITSEEYDRRTLEGDESIYLPQPNPKFGPTLYMDRIANVLGLDYKTLQEKFDRGEIKNKIATGRVDPETGKAWYDEDRNAVF